MFHILFAIQVLNLLRLTYGVDIRVRSKKHEQILRREWEQAQKFGIDFSTVQFDKLLVREDED